MIQIDMDMPDNCMECRFRRGDTCVAQDQTVKRYARMVTNSREEWCPLREVKYDNRR